MRTRFDRQLEQLNVELIRMGALCEEAISIVAKSLLDSDLTFCPMRWIWMTRSMTRSGRSKGSA